MFNPSGISGQRWSRRGSCRRSTVSRHGRSSPKSGVPTPRISTIRVWRLGPTKGSGRITGSKDQVSGSDEVNGPCKGSDHPDQPHYATRLPRARESDGLGASIFAHEVAPCPIILPTLSFTPSSHLELGESRPQTLSWLIIGVIDARTVNHGQLSIVVTHGPVEVALKADRKRRRIECLFGDSKTRGLNREDTRLTQPAKLDTLLVIITLAMAWASACATPSREPGRSKPALTAAATNQGSVSVSIRSGSGSYTSPRGPPRPGDGYGQGANPPSKPPPSCSLRRPTGFRLTI